MQIYDVKYPISIPQNRHDIVLAIGYFDGVHLGHQQVIKAAKERANLLGIPCAVMTFHPHPREVLGQQAFPHAVTPINEKMLMFKELGVDESYIVQFDKIFSTVSPKHFIDEVLLPLGVKAVVIGFNYTFGHKGAGTVEQLKRYSEGRYIVDVVDPVLIEGEQVSSTLIRERLLNGGVDSVSTLLGRPYKIRGKVIRGEGRGKKLGFPTANIMLSDSYYIPRTGVYAVKVKSHGHGYEGVMNVGYKPTFHRDETDISLEVHLFDYHADLYETQLEIEFISYLRGEKKFDSIELLVEQIKKDCEQAINKFVKIN